MGFKVMIHRASMLVVYKAVRGVMEELLGKGVVDRSHYAEREEVASLLGLDDVYEMESKYAVVG